MEKRVEGVWIWTEEEDEVMKGKGEKMEGGRGEKIVIYEGQTG